MRSGCKIITGLCILFIFNLSGVHAQKVLLGFKPYQGLKYESFFESYSTLKQVFMGIEQSIEANMKMKLEAEVDSTSAESIAISYEYTSLLIESTDGINSYLINSDEDSDNSFNSLFSSML